MRTGKRDEMMDLEFVKSAIRKSRYENETNQVKGLKLPVSVNLELVYPNQVKEGSAFLIITRTSVGNPVQKFSMYVEQVCSFKIVHLEDDFDTSRENMQKFISVICHPIALKEMQKAMDGLTALYQINPIKLPTNTKDARSDSNVLDLSGRGLPN